MARNSGNRWPGRGGGPPPPWPRARWPGPRVVVRCGEDSTPANCRSVRIRFDSEFDSAIRTGGYCRVSSGSKYRRSRPGPSGSRVGRLRSSGGRLGPPDSGGRRRPPGPGAQAADQGGSGRRDGRRGAGPDGQGGRADGQVRHRPGAARRAAAGDRSPRRPEGRRRQPLGPGPGPPALRRGGRDAVRQCVLLPRSDPGTRIHIFGFASDIERTDVLYTSLLLQMWQGLGTGPRSLAGAAARARGGEAGCWGSSRP